MNPVVIDVREMDEFEAEHIENSINVPLSAFEKQAPALLNSLKSRPILLMCRSGKRAGLAKSAAERLASVSCEVFEGGILEWKKKGHATVVAKAGHFPIMRQVQLIAGSLVLGGSALAYFVDARFALLSGFVGAGLTIAGATGFCGMAELLALLPFNKVR